MTVTLADIEAARRIIAGQVLRTPMLPAPKLSALTGAEVFVKYENLQVTNSFKERGALNKLASLDAAGARARRHRHVGRQSCAGGRLSRRAARHPGHHRDAGDHAVREGRGDPGARRRGGARRRDRRRCAGARRGDARERGLTFVHPYDDPQVIAGQGTIALEMLEDVPDLDTLVIPIGGGGLIAGNAIAARARQAAIEIVGAEAALYPSMWNALTGEQPPARRPDAGRRHRGQERRHADAADRARAGRRDRAGRRGAPRARGERLSHPAEDDGGRRRRRRPCRDAGRARALPRPQGRARSCAAAISTRASSPPSWCASSSARTASSRSA